MQPSGKILVVSQHYPPDPTTTATYVGAIARALAADRRVVVLSGSGDTGRRDDGAGPEVVAIPVWRTEKNAIVKRAAAILVLALRLFAATLRHAERRDVVFCVTTPFLVPYAVVLAAKLRGAAAVLLIYDLYPEALVAAGLASASSLPARLLRFANARLFRALDAIITIGRDVRPLLMAYDGVTSRKVHFIPNWTLLPTGYRTIDPANRFRPPHAALVVGLSGNLGFTHDPGVVFAAARLLKQESGIHVLLSGWGAGWAELERMYAAERPDNVTLLPPVADADLAEFLSCADVWVIPYRRAIAGVSIPSRLYNLLAVGRAIIVAAEPHAEAALVVAEEDAGWIVPPGDAGQLADAVRQAAADLVETLNKGRRAAAAAEKYTPAAAIERYRNVILGALKEQRA